MPAQARPFSGFALHFTEASYKPLVIMELSASLVARAARVREDINCEVVPRSNGAVSSDLTGSPPP